MATRDVREKSKKKRYRRVAQKNNIHTLFALSWILFFWKYFFDSDSSIGLVDWFRGHTRYMAKNVIALNFKYM